MRLTQSSSRTRTRAGPVARDQPACERILFVRRSWLSWGILSALGLVAILLPDTDRRLFSLSEEHGPSLIDGVGVLLLLAGWAALDIATWRRRRGLSLRRDVLVLMSTAGIAAIALVIWSALGDHGSWWIVGAVVLSSIQLAAAVAATFAERSTSGR